MRVKIGETEYRVAFCHSEGGKVTVAVIATDPFYKDVVSIGITCKSDKDIADRNQGRKKAFTDALKDKFNVAEREQAWNRYHEVFKPLSRRTQQGITAYSNTFTSAKKSVPGVVRFTRTTGQRSRRGGAGKGKG